MQQLILGIKENITYFGYKTFDELRQGFNILYEKYGITGFYDPNCSIVADITCVTEKHKQDYDLYPEIIKNKTEFIMEVRNLDLLFPLGLNDFDRQDNTYTIKSNKVFKNQEKHGEISYDFHTLKYAPIAAIEKINVNITVTKSGTIFN